MIRAITGCLQEALVDEKCKFVLFYGRGRGFCADGDVQELVQRAKEKAYDQVRSFFAREYIPDLMIHNYPKPVIVLADGITMGGGLGIAAGADIVIATERTRVAMPETKFGFFPGYRGDRLAVFKRPQELSRRVGRPLIVLCDCGKNQTKIPYLWVINQI